MESMCIRNSSISLRVVMILVSCIAFNSQLLAQEFGSKDSRWVYDHTGHYGITRVEFEKDTLIENIEFNKFSIVSTDILFSNGDTVTIERPPLCLSNNDGVVLFKIEEEEIDTLINFNANPGDSWSITRSAWADTFSILILDTFRTEFNGESLNSMSYRFWSTKRTTSFIDTIYDQIGNLHRFILPFDGWRASTGHGDIGGHIRCFTSNALGLVEFEKRSWINPLADYFEFECDRIVTTENLSDEVPLSIFPNPVSNELCLNEAQGRHIKIFKINGGLECSLESKNESCYDVSHLQAGLYFLRTPKTVIRFVKVP